MPARVVFPGQVYGRLTVIDCYGVKCLCRCTCGNTKTVRSCSLRRGVTTSCGCYNKEVLSSRAKHNMVETPEYNSWKCMLQRCNNPQNPNYRYYGEVGISVCEKWLDFVSFYNDIGPKPTSEHTLERINNDGNYEPGNVKWATRQEQANNRGHVKGQSITTFSNLYE